MKTDPASLDLLHDLAEPPPVPWWPLAPGWWFVIAVATALLVWLAFKAWKSWQANEYRRAALRELEVADTPADLSELLRRAALSTVPRTVVAGLRGEQWLSWLENTAADPMPPTVRNQLLRDVYGTNHAPADVTELKAYAEYWIRRHKFPESPSA